MKYILWIMIILSGLIIAKDLTSGKKSEEILYKEQVFSKQHKCLTDNIWHEARNQGTKGMTLVAEVTKNRVYSGKFAKDYCKVVNQPWQFTWVKQKQKTKWNRQELTAYQESYRIAYMVMQKDYKQILPSSVTHYHTTKVNPRWNKVYRKYAKFGSHVFYHMT
jgi:spore germination cell wall hydrolase CwlJ-like protein